MRILIACEYSGIVRESFNALGHDVWSCDILPTDIPGKHYQCDIFEVINQGWDMLIGFPPCTKISYVGNRWLDENKYGEKAVQRKKDREDGLKFFMRLYNAPIKRIALENPKGYPMQFIKPTQIIHPYYFGDEFKKSTCLWLRNLPPLLHNSKDTLFENKTHSREPDYYKILHNGKKITWTESLFYTIKDAKERAHIRSKTFPGIAKAMADTWGYL